MIGYMEQAVWRFENKGAHPVFEQLLQDHSASRRTLDAMVEEKLGRLLEYVVRCVPYYQQEPFRHVVKTQPPREALKAFPILKKSDIQNIGDKLWSPKQSVSRVNHSGGSTGFILNFYQDAPHWTHAAAGRRFGYWLSGWRPGVPVVFFWGNPAEMARKRKGVLGNLRDQIYRVQLYNAFAPTEETFEKVVHQLEKRPALLVGYASSLGLLAKHLRSKGKKVRTLAVQATADTLFDDLRVSLESTFQSQVFNRYGSRELSVVAHEGGDRSGMYILERNNFVEIVDEKGGDCPPGTVGKVVVTNLNNYAMPFLRYEIGDIGTWRGPFAGSESKQRAIAKIVGRENDLIMGPSGTAIYCEFFARLFYATAGIKQFQIIQDAKDHLNIKIVTEPSVDRPSLERHLTTAIKDHADKAFRIDFEYPAGIPTAPSGKRRYVYRTH